MIRRSIPSSHHNLTSLSGALVFLLVLINLCTIVPHAAAAAFLSKHATIPDGPFPCVGPFALVARSLPPPSIPQSMALAFWNRAHGNDNNNMHNKHFLGLHFFPPSIRIQRQQRLSVGKIQMNLFGLGLGEIAVILVVVGAVLGPANIGRLVKSSGSKAQDLMTEGFQRIPDEFQEGMEEGEVEAKARKAKRIKVVQEGRGGDEEGEKE